MPRMTLNRNEFLSEHGGRLLAGSAVAVSDEEAERWEDLGIARPSKASDKSARELRMAELKAEMELLEAEAPGRYSAAMTSDPPNTNLPNPMRRRGRPPARAPETDQDGLVNGPSDLPDGEDVPAADDPRFYAQAGR